MFQQHLKLLTHCSADVPLLVQSSFGRGGAHRDLFAHLVQGHSPRFGEYVVYLFRQVLDVVPRALACCLVILPL